MTFNLDKNAYKLFCKEKNKPICINIHSNQSSNTLKQLLKTIEKRISETLPDKDIIFEKPVKSFQGV